MTTAAPPEAATAHTATARRGPDRRFALGLAAVAAVGLTVRLGYLFWVRAHPQHGNIATYLYEGISGDGIDYHTQALRNLHGHWFIGVLTQKPAALHPPGWTLMLTLWGALGFKSIFDQQVLAAVLGTLTVVAVGLAARRVAGPRTGLLAAALAALYPGLWVYERALLSETLVMLEMAILILVAYRFRERPSVWGALGLGLLCGAVAMTRAEQILLLPLLAVPLIVGRTRGRWGRCVGWLAAAIAGTVLLTAPWTIYNLSRFEDPVLLSLGSGVNEAMANCDLVYSGPLVGNYSRSCPIATNQSDPSVADGILRHRALVYAEHHLDRLPVVMAAREGRAFGWWAPFQQTALDANLQQNALWVNRLELYAYWLLLIPAAGGVVVLRRRRTAVYPLLVPFVVVATTVLLTYGETRYRAPIEVPLVILAGAGLDGLWAWWRGLNAPGPHPPRPARRAEPLEADELSRG